MRAKEEALQLMVTDNPAKALRELHDKVGSNFSVEVPEGRVWFNNEADTMRKVLRCTTNRDPEFGKSKLQTHGLARTLGAENILLNDGAQWESSRRALAPLFAAHTIRNRLDLEAIIDLVDHHLEQISSEVDLGRAMLKLALAVALQYIFRTKSTDIELENLLAAYDVVNWQVRQEWLFPDSEQPGADFADAQATIDDFAHRLLEQRLSATDSCAIKLLANTRDPQTGDLYSPNRLHSEVKNLMLAGHETTASLLTWCLIELGRDSELQEQLRREVGTDRPTLEQLESFTELEGLWREVARRRPPNFLIARQALRDTQIGPEENPVRISTGDTVIVSTGQANEQSRGMFSFGGGRRFCLGFHLATLETKIVLTRFLQRFEFEDNGFQDRVSSMVQTPADAIVSIRAAS